ncbi:MAG: hypothetical protein EO766_17650 [Hydrotalea sp. AMD]|uniref:HNH endonuclease n=1 Tax=Hydrotalea sp. AMD TaxID=2501297 RepID=UPI0010268E29|nr:HNH endonuclease [Hydrotalea sp. AMD]RWZ83494.1 MAG: hypothetical protein EO766_17650 [Hydrotalea sp. AMD]
MVLKIGQKPILSNQERFESKFVRGSPDECWNWLGYINQYGYGDFHPRVDPLINKYEYIQAHRYSYKLYVGEITEQVVRHTCHNRRCVNPNHLVQGSHKDNGQDMVKAGRSLRGERNNKSVLTEDQVRVLLHDFDTGYYKGFYKDKAEILGIAYQTVHRICNRKNWKHIKW